MPAMESDRDLFCFDGCAFSCWQILFAPLYKNTWKNDLKIVIYFSAFHRRRQLCLFYLHILGR